MLHLIVLGSTRGTDMQAIIDAIKNGELDAKIEIVISNKPDAYILERARQNGIEAVYVGIKKDGVKKMRQGFDAKVLKILEQKPVDLVLLIGYMRILSPLFIQKFKGRIFNVHPSLLPAFAGGMDMDVHAEVLKAGVRETGCTVHIVDEGVDTGPVVIQKKCPVEAEETAETLKAKVQALEGEALIEAIKFFKYDEHQNYSN